MKNEVVVGGPANSVKPSKASHCEICCQGASKRRWGTKERKRTEEQEEQEEQEKGKHEVG